MIWLMTPLTNISSMPGIGWEFPLSLRPPNSRGTLTGELPPLLWLARREMTQDVNDGDLVTAKYCLQLPGRAIHLSERIAHDICAWAPWLKLNPPSLDI